MGRAKITCVHVQFTSLSSTLSTANTFVQLQDLIYSNKYLLEGTSLSRSFVINRGATVLNMLIFHFCSAHNFPLLSENEGKQNVSADWMRLVSLRLRNLDRQYFKYQTVERKDYYTNGELMLSSFSRYKIKIDLWYMLFLF